MNRSQFVDLARIRLDEADVLLAAGRSEGAYYLAGYAIECLLKAAIAKRTREHDFPPNRRQIENIYSHDLGRLLSAAELEDELRQALETDEDFGRRWNVVKDWSEQARYERPTLARASALLEAIREPDHGVLRWLQARC